MAKERINKYVPNWYYQLAGFGALAYWFGMYVKTYYGTQDHVAQSLIASSSSSLFSTETR